MVGIAVLWGCGAPDGGTPDTLKVIERLDGLPYTFLRLGSSTRVRSDPVSTDSVQGQPYLSTCARRVCRDTRRACVRLCAGHASFAVAPAAAADAGRLLGPAHACQRYAASGKLGTCGCRGITPAFAGVAVEILHAAAAAAVRSGRTRETGDPAQPAGVAALAPIASTCGVATTIRAILRAARRTIRGQGALLRSGAPGRAGHT